MYESPDFNNVMACTETLDKIIDVYVAAFEIERPEGISILDPQGILDTLVALVKAKKAQVPA